MARSFFSRVTGVALVLLIFGGASVSVAQTPIQVPNATFPMDSLPIGIAHDGTSLWVLDYAMDVMQQRSPTTGALVKSFPLGGVIPGAGDVAADGSGHLFITGAYPSTVFRMDVATGTISSLFQAPEVSRADGIAWDGTAFYMNGADDGTTFVYDSNGASVKSIPAWARPRGMSYDKQRHTLWSVDYWSGAIQEVTTQGQILRTCETGLPYLVTGIAIMNGSAYVSIAGEGPRVEVYETRNLQCTGNWNQSPTADAGPDKTFECASSAGRLVTLTGSGSDPEGDALTYWWEGPFGTAQGQTASVWLPLGQNHVTLHVSDGISETTDAALITIVGDSTAPAITSLSATPNVLWPPNQQMVPVSLKAEATDTCDPTPACSISSVSMTDPNWLIQGLTVALRAGDAKRDGLAYTINVTCADKAGNSTSKSLTVTVPHDKR